MTRRTLLGVCLDLSGTLFYEEVAAAGGPAAVRRLRDVGLKVSFLSNATRTRVPQLREKMLRLGYEVNDGEIVTALSAGVDLIRARKLKPMVFVSEDMAKEFEGLSAPHDGVGDEADSVVMGLAPDMCNYEQLNRAFRLVRNGAPLIALYKGRYRQNAVGELDLGPGPFVAALEYACDVRAEVVGKPAPAHFNLALRRMGLPPSQVAMVGDDVHDDALGAVAHGMSGVLLRTGKYRPGDDAKALPDGRKATVVVDSIVEAADWLIHCATLPAEQGTAAQQSSSAEERVGNGTLKP